MKALDRNIWRSSISLQTKVGLYNTYILPILLYGANNWSMTKSSSRRIDAFDQWCLPKPYTAYLIYSSCHRRGGQVQDQSRSSYLSHYVTSRRLRLFGHTAGANPTQDHQRALRAAINRLPRGRPGTWLHTVELDLQPHNLDLNLAWKRAQDRSKWRQLVETAMFIEGRAA